MLYVLFQAGNERYALEASNVVEVIPLLALKRLPQSPKGVAGLFVYRGRPVPAVDLGELLFDRPARQRMSTRIIVINYSSCVSGQGGPNRRVSHAVRAGQSPECAGPANPVAPVARGRDELLLGLIAERAIDTIRRDTKEFKELGVSLAATPFLGPIVTDDKGVIQLVYAQRLLAENIQKLLLSAASTPATTLPREAAAPDVEQEKHDPD